MTSRIRTGCLGAMACGALALLLPALGQADEQLVPTGSLAYTWQAQPQLGCAKQNLCGVRGAVIVGVEDASYSQQEGFGSSLNLDIAATARTQGPGAGASCVDALDIPSLDMNVPRGSRPVSEAFYGDLSSGRCAGPLMEDLNRLPIRVQRLGRHHPSFRLEGTRTIAAGPYRARIDSSLVLHPGNNGVSSSTGYGTGTRGGGRSSRVELLAVRYRIASVTGTPVASFSAITGPFCDALDECGASGAVSLSPVGWRRPFVITASSKVPPRLSRAQALRNMQTGRVDSYAFMSLRVNVDETIGGGQTGSCSGTGSRPVVLLMLSAGRTASLQIADTSNDPLRTYCPGPAENDLISQETNSLLNGSIHTNELGTRSPTLSLGPGKAPSGQAYSSYWSGSMVFHLVRTGISLRTIKQAAP